MVVQRVRIGYSFVITLLVFCAIASGAAAQPTIPTISARQFVGGSAKVTITGAFNIDADIAINGKASFGDGEMTWLQFGVSGAAEPNALITYQPNEVGITVARGKTLSTAGIMSGARPQCTGKVSVTSVLISGHYVCRGVTSHDPATGKLGKVDVEVAFTARSST